MNKCIHNEHPRNCGICEDIHALQNLVESLKIENSVLRAEVKAWRSGWYDDDASDGKLARARAATDAAKALEES